MDKLDQIIDMLNEQGDQLDRIESAVTKDAPPSSGSTVVATGSLTWPTPNVPGATNDVDIVNAREAHVKIHVTEAARLQYGGGNAPNQAQPVQMWISEGVEPNGGHVQDAFSSGNNFANAGKTFDAAPGDYCLNFFTLDRSGITGNLWITNG